MQVAVIVPEVKLAHIIHMDIDIYEKSYIMLRCLGRRLMNPVQFYKCLADETRLYCLLLILLEQELCVCELVDTLDEIQPKISRHLAQLRKCGLLQDRRQGQWVFYRINPQLPQWCREVLERTAAGNTLVLEPYRQRLQALGNRPQRLEACGG